MTVYKTMETKIKPITSETLSEAQSIIENGGVVGMPTETVYGLGGNAFNDEAVKKIFEVKGRPNNNPLIAHVHKDFDLSQIIDYDPPYAKKLREAFLPGPLTLVYPSTGKVSPYVSCGLNTLAVRVPSHEGAQAFLKKVNIPIVAPSANLSKHVSPTSARHVFDDFNGKIPLILDGGECEGGIESTVCDVTGDVPVVLRPGLVTREMIATVVGDCWGYDPDLTKAEKVKSPGLLYKHYAPRCETKLYQKSETALAREACETALASGKKVACLCESAEIKVFEKSGVTVLDFGANEREMAQRLYALLRKAETLADVLIVIEPTDTQGVMTGVLNRLRKACVSKDVLQGK